MKQERTKKKLTEWWRNVCAKLVLEKITNVRNRIAEKKGKSSHCLLACSISYIVLRLHFPLSYMSVFYLSTILHYPPITTEKICSHTIPIGPKFNWYPCSALQNYMDFVCSFFMKATSIAFVGLFSTLIFIHRSLTLSVWNTWKTKER